VACTVSIRAESSAIGPISARAQLIMCGRKIAHGAVGPARRAPVGGRLGIGEEILGMLAAEPRDVADGALGEQLRANCVAGVRT
jgi:hypothetical protein